MTTGEIILYQTPEGALRLEIYHDGDTFWLSQRQLADLFGVEVPTISYHLKAIYESGELTEAATIRNLRMVRSEGNRSVSRDITHYHLDAVISVGYRVNSVQATRFRIWATETLRSFITKGFVLDDERLKLNSRFGPDYFDELLERIRDIRSSERRFYQKVLDIYATSVDYTPDAEQSQRFFAAVQNKMHWATHGHTAAEIIHERADSTRPFMGLQTTRPGGIVRKDDATVAKNYLSENELQVLNRIVNLYIEYAELQALERKPMTMRDWITKLDEFLKISGRELLDHAGRISADDARARAEREYARYRALRDAQPRRVDADFEKAAKALKKLPRPRKPKAGKP